MVTMIKCERLEKKGKWGGKKYLTRIWVIAKGE